MPPRVAVLVFPGSNCDHDAYHAAKHVFGAETRFVWHKDEALGEADLVVVPGGFSYGDYLRAGAIARFSPVMQSVARFAAEGGLVLGVCNGFQVLCEAGLLPGALVRNASLRFVCRDVRVRVETAATPFTQGLAEGDVLTVPVAHGEGNYVDTEANLDHLEAAGQVVFRYVDAAGAATPEASPNGSSRGIAGIANDAGNVLGMMPHPERCVEALLGHRLPDAAGRAGSGADGARLFASVFEHIAGQAAGKAAGPAVTA